MFKYKVNYIQIRYMSKIQPKAYSGQPALKTNVGTTPLSGRATIRQDHRRNYNRDGYLIVRNLFNTSEIDSMISDIIEIVRGKYGEFDGYIKPQGQLKDEEVANKYARIEFPHKISPYFQNTILSHPKITDILTCLIGPNVKCMNSKLYIKGPGERSRLWHQDETFIATRDRSLLGVYIALDDHSDVKSCIFAHPGSHRSGVLYPLRPPIPVNDYNASIIHNNNHNNNINNNHTHNHTHINRDVLNEDIINDDNNNNTSNVIIDKNNINLDQPYEAYDPNRDPIGVPIDLTAGSVVFINGYTLHRMQPTVNNQTRRAIKIHYCSAESWLPWAGTISPNIPVDNRDIVLVAGKDPYEYKGIQNINKTKAYPVKVDN